MEIIYLNKECNNDLKDSCVALGFFDGMHLGHQKLVEKVIEIADKKNLKKALESKKSVPIYLFVKNQFVSLPKKEKQI